MELKRVVVTGLGALTPIGNTKDDFWKALVSGKSGCAPITYFNISIFFKEFNYILRICPRTRCKNRNMFHYFLFNKYFFTKKRKYILNHTYIKRELDITRWISHIFWLLTIIKIKFSIFAS